MGYGSGLPDPDKFMPALTLYIALVALCVVTAVLALVKLTSIITHCCLHFFCPYGECRLTWHADIKQYLSWWIFEARGRTPHTTSASTLAVSGDAGKPSATVVSCEPLRSQIHAEPHHGLSDATVLTFEGVEEVEELPALTTLLTPFHWICGLDPPLSWNPNQGT